jgi:hypothetical protein
MAKIYRPPTQGTAYAQPGQVYRVQYRLLEGDCAIATSGSRIDRRQCVLGPGVIEYTRTPNYCLLTILEGCTRSTYVREMP